MEDRFASVDGLRRFDFAAEAVKRFVIFFDRRRLGRGASLRGNLDAR